MAHGVLCLYAAIKLWLSGLDADCWVVRPKVRQACGHIELFNKKDQILHVVIQIAGILLDNYARGRTKHVWFSISSDLIVDAKR